VVADNLISHLESTLGSMDGGWSKTDRGDPLSVRVVRFRDKPATGLTTFVTLGLSRNELALSDGRPVRVELIASCWERDAGLGMPSVLVTAAEQVMSTGRAPARGSILGPAGPLFSGSSSLTALYCSIPIFFPDELRVWDGSVPPTVMIQMIPITDDEATFANSRGWSAFEDHLEQNDPDVFELRRGSSLSQ
jgi:hypothetical protein